LPVAFLALASAELGLALPPPTIARESIPADAPSMVKQAIAQLYLEDSQEQTAALEALEEEGAAAYAAVPFLMAMLPRITPGWLVLMADSADDQAGYQLLHTLAAIGRPAVGPLVEALGDKRSIVRAGAAYALSLTRAPVPVAPLLSALHDPDPRVREYAVDAVSGIEGQAVTEALRTAAGEQNSRVRAEAAEALAARRDPTAVGLLIAVLKGKDRESRWGAASALGRLRDRRAVEPLIAALRDNDQFVREEAADALGEIGDPRAVPALLKSLKDKDSLTAAYAAKSLGKLHDLRALEPLLAAFHDPGSPIKQAALEALGGMPDPRAFQALLGAFQESNPDLRAAAARGLGQTGKEDAAAPLMAALRDPSPRVRGDAAYALLALRAVTAAPALVEALGVESDDTTCCILVDTLARFGHEAVAPLAAALKGSDPRLRYEAALALAGTHDPGAADLLLGARDDQSPSVRAAVLHALVQIKGRDSIPCLTQALGDPDGRVRRYSSRLLIEMTGQLFGEDAAKWREWWEEQPPVQAAP
jgi:HEAT repeat protein